MGNSELSKRERMVLEAVIRTYVQTAEPAGSRTLSRRFGLGVSPATIRKAISAANIDFSELPISKFQHEAYGAGYAMLGMDSV